MTAAVIERDGSYLVTRRLAGAHLEGYWEFPGGKCEPGESHADCLAREIDEELGCGAAIGSTILTTIHDYPDWTIELHFIECTMAGEPRPILGQEIRWVPKAELRSLEFPPADEELIRLLTA